MEFLPWYQIPDDPARVAAPGDLPGEYEEDDWEAWDADGQNDADWLEEHREKADE